MPKQFKYLWISHTHTYIRPCVCVWVCVCVHAYVPDIQRCVNCLHTNNTVYILPVRQWPGRPGFNPRSSHTKDLKKWYLIPPCLTLSIIRYGSRVKWSNPGKGVAPSPTPWCSSYRKGSLRVTLDYGRPLIYIYIYICVCVCVCVDRYI